MGSKVEYVESSHMYATNYVRNSKAIGVLWGIFSICYAIIVVVSLVTPEWVGDTMEAETTGRFGLFARCMFPPGGGPERCEGGLDDLRAAPSGAFRAAAVLVAAAALLALIAIAAMLLFFFVPATTVFHVCAWIQVLSAVSLGAGVAVFPAGWDAAEVRAMCGPAAGLYQLGACGLRWAFLLALIGCLDAAILAALAFILATRHVRLQPEPAYANNGSLYKGEVNGGFVGDAQSVAGSRKSLNLHPVLLMPQPHGPEADRFSEFSNRTGRSKASGYRPEYASSIQNFQL
ncbi:LHFPL tetraspan subfamily member 3 protein [Schistocerca piceifrons]|uniref:LHFPL tetraspan subfamily member 3 protein n=1 Tax=Schistocerca piceifrons TaxID=274613 RepID=UPI001F5F118A|nr:LHFPL tetraspan subfamily member 3 protein [Schistocerca piceifrons]XP_049787982.1 LHFPL tetraspan subfamily member 3 protein [Schistocerca cancellata]XP_049814842.1 LHFPL tetraspan subfamily member 3 protein [Schistocerca nitens]XP_049830389.1 LHFPL tetraspan subfamily member 3 protein [Schistocerca gregaria]XP_049963796.1 LHFPL tetraspan subfamily member 3 protein [Schistocerca serialis cubense]